MQQQSQSIKKLDILCIGQIQSGKSYFLKQYTKDQVKQVLLNTYEIFAKRINKNVIYFHQLNEQQILYMQTKYDGILFFVDLINTWNVVENILKWLQLQSKLTGINIYKIPLRVIVTKTRDKNIFKKWKKSLQAQLQSLVEIHQIIYFENIEIIQQPLQKFIQEICQDKGLGIKCTTFNQFRLYGISQIVKTQINYVKLVMRRAYQGFQKNIKSRIHFGIKQHNK